MKVFECPQMVESYAREVEVFLAGGISGCPDWQSTAIDLFKAYKIDELVLVNPRRAIFDITDPEMSAKQINWEAHNLMFADIILFWFPKETLCPITLFELGKHASNPKDRIFVGCHPEYQRAFDVKHQLSLIPHHSKTIVHSTLNDLVEAVVEYIG